MSLSLCPSSITTSNEISMAEISTSTLSKFPIRKALRRCLKENKYNIFQKKIRFWSIPSDENNIAFFSFLLFPFQACGQSGRADFFWMERRRTLVSSILNLEGSFVVQTAPLHLGLCVLSPVSLPGKRLCWVPSWPQTFWYKAKHFLKIDKWNSPYLCWACLAIETPCVGL